MTGFRRPGGRFGEVPLRWRQAALDDGPPARASRIDTARTIQQALATAGLLSGARASDDIAGIVERSLRSAGLMRGAAMPQPGPDGRAGPARGQVYDGQATSCAVDEAAPAFVERTDADVPPGRFLAAALANAAGTRDYRLYVPAPAAHPAGPLPLLVMLHGCTQSPEDFAAGTRMNELADAHGFLVAYPAQAARANGSRCWNWFDPAHQQRGGGEASLIADIALRIAAQHPVDRKRIFVAGLSAGGAMAAILGATYPDVFAAVGVHSGLPYRAAHDLPSALGAMQRGSSRAATAAPAAGAAGAGLAVPTIVFHGDRDSTVDASNGARIVAGFASQPGVEARVEEGIAPGGRRYRRTVYTRAGARPVAEHWVLGGAGHAWSGGSAAGSYTDASGPHASAEMLRFFLAATRAEH